MPKIITAKRLEGEAERARDYVKTHILFPSAILGMIFIVSGMAALAYQFIAESYRWETFLESSGLLVLGGVLGWTQTRYHRYLLQEYPDFFASRMRTFVRTKRGRSKRENPSTVVTHEGRALVPWGYLAGFVLLVGASALATLAGHVSYMAAYLVPWAGFFWAKLFFWRKVMAPTKGGRR